MLLQAISYSKHCGTDVRFCTLLSLLRTDTDSRELVLQPAWTVRSVPGEKHTREVSCGCSNQHNCLAEKHYESGAVALEQPDNSLRTAGTSRS